MIGVIDIQVQAKSPNFPLWPLRAYINSPSSLRVRNVPKKIGQWEITSVQVNVNYPDKTLKTAQCVLVGGVWVCTLEGSPTAGSYTNGYTVLANGTDENGNPVSGYVLGRGDVEILKEDGTPIADDPTHFVTDDELDAAISSKAEISSVEEVAEDVANLANSLSDYYTKSETSSATEIQTALDGKQPTGDYALASQLPTKTSELSNDSSYITSVQVEPSESVGFEGYAEKSRHSAFVTAIDFSTGKYTDKAILAGELKTNTTTGELELDFSSEIVGKYPWTLRELFGTQYSPQIMLNWKKASIYRKRIISDRVVWAVVKTNQWMWVADGQFAITTDAAGEPDGNFYVLYYEDETHKNCINDPATDVHQITIENNVSDNIRIATIDGQTGQIDCYSYLRDYPLSIRALAYRDELSAKADVSALNAVESSLSDYALVSQIPLSVSQLENDAGYLTEHQSLSDYYTKNETSSATELQTAFNNVSVDLSEYYTKSQTSSTAEISNALALKQDKLSDAQVSAIDSVVDERKTVVKYDDDSIVAYDIDGTLSQNALDVSGKNIIEVKIGNAVTAIGAHCFDSYKQLVNVYIPNSVTTIDRYAFIECDNLTGLLIPESVTSIGDYAFYGCDSLTGEVIIPDSVTSIGEEVFVVTHCPKFVIGSGVTNIGRNVFLGNGGRIKEVTFKGKTLAEVQSMTNYPWSIGDTSIIKTYNVASKEWVLEQLSALEARIAALEGN